MCSTIVYVSIVLHPYLHSSAQTLSWKFFPLWLCIMPWLMMAKHSLWPFDAVQYPASELMPVSVPVFALTLPYADVPLILDFSVPSTPATGRA